MNYMGQNVYLGGATAVIVAMSAAKGMSSSFKHEGILNGRDGWIGGWVDEWEGDWVSAWVSGWVICWVVEWVVQ